MAGIDKTYITCKEYPLYRQWWIDNYEKMIKELGKSIWLYPFHIFDIELENITPDFLLSNNKDIEEFKNIAHDFPIWNTSSKDDEWLVKNCDIKSFRNRMLEVYPFNWIGFKGQKWVSKPKIKQQYKR